MLVAAVWLNSKKRKCVFLCACVFFMFWGKAERCEQKGTEASERGGAFLLPHSYYANSSELCVRLIGWLNVLLADRTDKAAFSSEALGRGGGEFTRNKRATNGRYRRLLCTAQAKKRKTAILFL